jgi:hypothetical protein
MKIEFFSLKYEGSSKSTFERKKNGTSGRKGRDKEKKKHGYGDSI